MQNIKTGDQYIPEATNVTLFLMEKFDKTVPKYILSNSSQYVAQIYLTEPKECVKSENLFSYAKIIMTGD